MERSCSGGPPGGNRNRLAARTPGQREHERPSTRSSIASPEGPGRLGSAPGRGVDRDAGLGDRLPSVTPHEPGTAKQPPSPGAHEEHSRVPLHDAGPYDTGTATKPERHADMVHWLHPAQLVR